MLQSASVITVCIILKIYDKSRLWRPWDTRWGRTFCLYTSWPVIPNNGQKHLMSGASPSVSCPAAKVLLARRCHNVREFCRWWGLHLKNHGCRSEAFWLQTEEPQTKSCVARGRLRTERVEKHGNEWGAIGFVGHNVESSPWGCYERLHQKKWLPSVKLGMVKRTAKRFRVSFLSCVLPSTRSKMSP